MIRKGDLAKYAALDLAQDISIKMENNAKRAFRHGDKRA